MTTNDSNNKGNSSDKKKKLFKYTPDDFKEQEVKVQHMDLHFDIYDTETKAKSTLHAKTLDRPIDHLDLNAKNLCIHCVTSKNREVRYDYNKDEHKLHVLFDEPVQENTEFEVSSENTITPTSNILEGLYFDETPAGAPPQQITQCQQWGFQRLVPSIDEMNAKCTYRTTITADARYTNLITNGDVVVDRHDVGDGRVAITYENMKTPMATYLFFLGAGTYATFTREFEYSNGDTFMLELLVPPESDETIASHALDILHDAIMWIHVCTGPNKYENEEVSKHILELIQQREQAKKDNNEQNVTAIRQQLKDLTKDLTLGYKYTGTVYREIGMQNSDFGGMENVGNTTITTNRIMPFKEMTDRAFEYMIRVKCHEFYHNLNGSEVTGWSPFEIWLNEAVTVHIEKEYHAFLFGEEYARLQDVIGLLAPTGGTFMMDESAASMPIVPDGFNDPNELITAVTYVKAPEFVRMIQTVMGRDVFVKGLDTYHRRFAHDNAKWRQWIEAMEEASGKTFEGFATTWLKKTGFPHVNVTRSFVESDDGKKLVVELDQMNVTDSDFWQFPFRIGVFGKDGKMVSEQLVFVDAKVFTITFDDIGEGDVGFVSLNRGYTFYGKVHSEVSDEELFMQVEQDDDLVNRYMAFYALLDKEKTRLLQSSDERVDEKIVDLYFGLLSDDALMEKSAGQILAVLEYVEDERFAHEYQMLYDVKKKILRAVAEKYKDGIVGVYERYSDDSFEGTYIQKQVAGVKRRQVKNIALGLLSTLDTDDVHALIVKQFESSENATDKVSSFRLICNSSISNKDEIISSYEEVAKQSLVSWEAFLSVVAGSDGDDALSLIERVEKNDSFRIEQANDQRALYAVFSHNKKKSLQTEDGRVFLRDRILKLAPVNEYNTLHMLKNLGSIDKMDERFYVPLVQVLVDVLEGLDSSKTPSVFNTALRMLHALPKGVEKYEKEVGEISFLKD